MDNIEHQAQRMHPFLSLVILFLFFVSGLFIFSFVGIYVVSFLFGLDVSQTQLLLTHGRYSEIDRSVILVYQAISTPIGGFIVPVLVWNRLLEKKSTTSLFGKVPINLMAVLAFTGLFVITFMPVNSVFIEWNSAIILPNALKEMEIWMKVTEQQLAQTTKFITNFQNPFELSLGILVIGCFTAFGEELFFRGVFQTKLIQITKNVHWAIWITGFIFSFVHFQFYGFVPRMLLGVIFGYLYYWSGSLLVPVFAHFVNNTFTLLMIHLNNRHIVTFDVESAEKMPWAVVLVAVIFVIIFLKYFYTNRVNFN